ncbi:hypothetical protein H4R18_004850, partial [Coemansia javaensis]
MGERGYSTDEVRRYMRAAVDLAVGDGEYRHGQAAELHNNIVDYVSKKIAAIRPPAVKTAVTCTIVQNTGGFHVGHSTRWDDQTDAMVVHEFTNKAMTII